MTQKAQITLFLPKYYNITFIGVDLREGVIVVFTGKEQKIVKPADLELEISKLAIDR